jgi:hypothetical protein
MGAGVGDDRGCLGISVPVGLHAALLVYVPPRMAQGAIAAPTGGQAAQNIFPETPGPPCLLA